MNKSPVKRLLKLSSVSQVHAFNAIKHAFALISRITQKRVQAFISLLLAGVALTAAIEDHSRRILHTRISCSHRIMYILNVYDFLLLFISTPTEF